MSDFLYAKRELIDARNILVDIEESYFKRTGQSMPYDIASAICKAKYKMLYAEQLLRDLDTVMDIEGIETRAYMKGLKEGKKND